MNIIAVFSTILCAAILSCSSCCQFRTMGSPYWDAPSFATYRTDVEWVPNAKLVRIDTRPVSRLGRCAFVPGTDGLLVVTQIVYWPNMMRDESGRWVITSAPIDRERERLWITIPAGTAEGQTLQLEELMNMFLTGYDMREMDSDGFYVKPYGISGELTVVSRELDRLVVDLDVEIRPKDRSNWTVRGRYDIPATPEGIHAKPPQEGDKLIEVRR